MSNSTRSPQVDEISLKQLYRMLRRRRGIVWSSIIGCLLIAITVSLVMKKHWTADVQLLLVELPPNINAAEVQDPDTAPVYETIETQLSMISTLTMAHLASDKIKQFAAAQKVSLEDIDTDPEILQTRVRADNPLKTDVLLVSMEADSPQKAALMANAYAYAFIDWKRGLAQANAKFTADTLEKRVAEAERELRGAEQKLSGYQKANSVGDIEDLTRDLIDNYSKRQSDEADEIQQVRATDAKLEREKTQLDKMSGQIRGSESFRDDTYILDQQKKLADLLAQRDLLKGTFTDAYPGQVDVLNEEIQKLKDRLAAYVKTTVNGSTPTLANETTLSGDFEQTRILSAYNHAMLDATRQVLAKLNSEINKLPSIQKNYAELKRDVTTLETRYTLLLSRYASARADEDKAVGNIELAHNAFLPVTPSRPIWGLNVALGILLGCLVTTIRILVAEQRQPRVYDEDQLRQLSDYEVLSTSHSKDDLPLAGLESVVSKVNAKLINELRENTSNGLVVSLAPVSDETDAVAVGAQLAQQFATLGRHTRLMVFGDLEIAPGQAASTLDTVKVPSDITVFGETNSLQSTLRESRQQYEITLVACPPASNSPELYSIGPLTDYNILYVRYGKTLVSSIRSVLLDLGSSGSQCILFGLPLQSNGKKSKGRKKVKNV